MTCLTKCNLFSFISSLWLEVKAVSHGSDWQLACKRQRYWDLARGACGQHNMCTINKFDSVCRVIVWAGRARERARESYTHTELTASSPVSVCSQSAGTIGSIVQLAGPCVPAPPPYLSTETGVFLLVTHSPATLPAAYTQLTHLEACIDWLRTDYRYSSHLSFEPLAFLLAFPNSTFNLNPTPICPFRGFTK